MSNLDEPVMHFDTFNFKLAVMEVLMYEKGLLAPKLDAHEFAREYSRRKIDLAMPRGYASFRVLDLWGNQAFLSDEKNKLVLCEMTLE